MSIILFVDDDQSILQVTKIQLNSFKRTNIVMSSGQILIDFLSREENLDTEIGLIFLDLTMPGMSGFEVLSWLKRNKINIPVIIQTGIEDRAEINKALNLGAKDVLLKPYTRSALKYHIEKWVRVFEEV